jgi:phosphatidate cytidylyltransferase
MTRILTSIIGIPALIYLVKYAPLSAFVGIAFVAMLLMLREYLGLIRSAGHPGLPWLAYLLASAVTLAFCFHVPADSFVPLFALLALSAVLFTQKDPASALSASAFTVFGALYIGGLMGYLVGVRMADPEGETGSDLLMMLFVIIWAGDIFAYLFGKTMGRHKLAAVSPNKTMEGAIAGLASSILASLACRYLFAGQVPVIHAALLGAVVGILGQIGDLCESILKRAAGVKDSGTIIPGHGGILDRVDSLLFGAPAIYYYSWLFLHR